MNTFVKPCNVMLWIRWQTSTVTHIKCLKTNLLVWELFNRNRQPIMRYFGKQLSIITESVFDKYVSLIWVLSVVQAFCILSCSNISETQTFQSLALIAKWHISNMTLFRWQFFNIFIFEIGSFHIISIIIYILHVYICIYN